MFSAITDTCLTLDWKTSGNTKMVNHETFHQVRERGTKPKHELQEAEEQPEELVQERLLGSEVSTLWKPQKSHEW